MLTTLAGDKPNRWWPEVEGADTGAVRHIGATKAGEFVSIPIGILDKGVTIEAREPLKFRAHNPITGKILATHSLARGQRVTLPSGPGALILRGTLE